MGLQVLSDRLKTCLAVLKAVRAEVSKHGRTGLTTARPAMPQGQRRWFRGSYLAVGHGDSTFT